MPSKPKKIVKNPLHDFIHKVINQWLVCEQKKVVDVDSYCDEAEKFDELVVSMEADQISNSFFDLVEELAQAQGLNGKDVAWQIRKEFNRLFQEEHYDSVTYNSQRVVLVGIPLFGNLENTLSIVEIVPLFRKSGMAPEKSNVQLLGLLDSLSTLRLAQDFETITKFKEEFTQVPKPMYESLSDYIKTSDFTPNHSPHAPHVAIFAINSHFTEEEPGIIPAFDGDNFGEEPFDIALASWEENLASFLKNKDGDVQELLSDCAPFSLLDAGIFSLRASLTQSFYSLYWSEVLQSEVSNAQMIKEMIFLNEATNENVFVVFFDDEDSYMLEFSLTELPVSVIREIGEMANAKIYDFEQKEQKIREFKTQLQASAIYKPSSQSKKLH